MKFIVTAALAAFGSMASAQECSKNLLFKPGARWEYKTYMSESNPFTKKKLMESTRLSYAVTGVKDSNNVTYSYISKTGTNPVNESLHYTVHYVVTCDGSKVTVPADFFTAEIIYFSNYFADGAERNAAQKDTGYYAKSVMKDAPFLYLPLGNGGGKVEFSSRRISSEIHLRLFETVSLFGTDGQRSSSVTKGRKEMTVPADADMEEPRKMGIGKVTTPAGTFDCEVIKVKGKGIAMGLSFETISTYYYSPELGFVKGMHDQGKQTTGLFELVNVQY
ncbi:hypothetical protein [Paraflavitalea sp. CAU 1676]|uniref:TapB family protein n=1 Tax=Paraflavitalea sp. CAU 1676 TaxID=3032598 RepID=UPI0023DC88E9|nr:hypothetical protein [Paraflavitalea sp. CAU 1676]MDF2191509.1 hypothetical protein [Paraflavitalea sp. CAU 1676]